MNLAASVSDIEQALRRDVADDARSKMSNAIINGATPDGTNPERIEGLITEIGTATDCRARRRPQPTMENSMRSRSMESTPNPRTR